MSLRLFDPFRMKKVESYKIYQGAELLEALEPSKKKDRLYPLDGTVSAVITTDVGSLHVKTLPGFFFDGRSGGPLIDFYVPNLGTLQERLAWYMHDCLGYGGSLDFKSTNRILRFFLRDICKYRPSKSWLIETAVGADDSWYGDPKYGDRFYPNVDKVETLWLSKIKDFDGVSDWENLEARR